MTSLKRELPPLNALVTFEAAARLNGFTRAADELHITQAAVSRQIQRLESQLGTLLFHRSHRTLELTGAGRRLHEAVASGLGTIGQGIRQVRMANSEPPVTLAATIAFSNYWLMPRLHDFRQQHPEIDVRILADDRNIDPAVDDVDIAIAFGEEEAVPGKPRCLIGRERVVPVCAPDYLTRAPHLQRAQPADLAAEELLHLDPEHWSRLHGNVIDWPVWFEQFGVQPGHGLQGIRLNNYPIMMDAVLAGRGIALGWRPIIDDLLASGRLVRLIEHELPTPCGYWATIAANRRLSPYARRVYTWLLEQSAPADTAARAHRRPQRPSA